MVVGCRVVLISGLALLLFVESVSLCTRSWFVHQL
jgi:hypothetical protein